MSTEKFTPAISHSPTLQQLASVGPLIPFDPVSLDFVAAFADRMTRHPEARIHPELMALAFWMRRANLLRWRADYVPEHRLLQARGTVFHIAPSNVDTIFVYSWFLSLICGNKNIVRVPSQERSVTTTILSVMQELFQLEEFQLIRDRTLLVRYRRDHSVNQLFSSQCDLRIIWGGDETINSVRQASLPPTAIEMTFADKFSLAVLSAKQVVQSDETELYTAAEAFYNDSIWFGQMACSSPRLVLWLNQDSANKEVNKARERWWSLVEQVADEKKLTWEFADYIDKRVVVDQMAIEAGPSQGVSITANPYFTRIWLDQPAIYADRHCGAGLFHESSIAELSELTKFVNRKVQTVIYFGVQTRLWQELLRSNAVPGIDRVVPLGQALHFHPVWDGFDLSRMLMREIQLL